MVRSRVVLALLAVLTLAVAGCVSENRPEDCDEPEKTIDLTVTAEGMEPNDPAACRGQHVELVVRSEVDGVFHIHGLDSIVPATTISPGDAIRLEFEADRSGQFPIELHPAGSSAGVDLGILALYER